MKKNLLEMSLAELEQYEYDLTDDHILAALQNENKN